MVTPPSSSRLGFRNEEYQAACYSMANEIDDLVGRNKVPEFVQEYPSIILDHISGVSCDDEMTKAAVMVLLLSVKSACQVGWFQEKETQDLLAAIDLMWNSFTSAENVVSSVDSPLSLFTQVIERFYPLVKLQHVVVSFEAKPDSKILLKDFYLSKKMPFSPKSKLCLFVVRTEDISKSNCIMHPQQVSFLLNGRIVEKKDNDSMDSGPQPPTNVTKLLNPGANLLQAIGCFGGSYFIVIAFIEDILLPQQPMLKEYVHSEAIESSSDNDIIEGPSRISLSCPISQRRIKLPVKGHVCKHLQCFDFSNYVDINSRRPSWRCPLCSQSVCYTEIRVDQNMKKILEEVGDNVADVVISADGSWTVATENNKNVDHVHETTHDHGDPKSLPTSGPTIMDLTKDEDEMDTSGGTHVDEQKPCLSEIPDLSNNTHTTATDSTMLNQSSTPINVLPELPQTLNVFSGQPFMNRPQIVNTHGRVARQPMLFLPNSSPHDRLATSAASICTPMPQYSQFPGSHVTPLGQCQGRASDLMERWNYISPTYGSGTNQTQSPAYPTLQHHYAMQNQSSTNRSLSLAQQRPMLSSVAQPQTLPVNYGRTTNQRLMQVLDPASMEQLRGFMNLASANSQQQTRPQNQMANTAYWQSQARPQNQMANTANWQSQARPQNQMANTANWQSQTRPQNQMAYTANRQPQTQPRNQITNTANWQPLERMRGSITPGSTAYDHRIILPTQPVQAQAQTLPPPQTTTYRAEQLQAFLEHPSYPINTTETQLVDGLLPVAGGLEASGTIWSMPHETW